MSELINIKRLFNGSHPGNARSALSGIDLSQAALDLAGKALETLGCSVRFDHCDFVAALRDRPEAVDVAWIGLSLHHHLAPAKLELMREIRGIVGDHGLFLIYENAASDGEDRDAWLLRRERQHRLLWTALEPEEYEAMAAHVRANDFPETTSRWHLRLRFRQLPVVQHRGLPIPLPRS